MNILVDELPTTVGIDGVEYQFNSNFRHLILFENLMLEEGISPEEKTSAALNLFYPKIPRNLSAAGDFMALFYGGGEAQVNSKFVKKGLKSLENKRIYDFDFDSNYIYAAFLSQYGLDLQDIEYLHWWKFKAMFHALSEDNKICKIMEYRAVKIDNSMSKNQREFYAKMKDLYRIPLSDSEQEKHDRVVYALQNGASNP